MLDPAAPEAPVQLWRGTWQKLGLPWFWALNLPPLLVPERCFLLAFTADK